MDEAPKYLSFPYKDVMSDGRLMLLENDAYAVFWRLALMSWQMKGVLPDDDASLAGWARVKLSRWGKIKLRAMSPFQKTDAGWVYPILMTEYNKATTRIATASESGRRGAQKRWQPHDEPMSQSNGEPIATPVAAQLDAGSYGYEYGNKNKTKDKTATSAGGREDDHGISSRLSGIHLTLEQEAGASAIFACASDAFRPQGKAGQDWAFPHHDAVNLATFLDSLMVGKPALIAGVERYPHEREITAALIQTAFKDRPAGVKSLCKFIAAIWERCQRDGVMPGAPIVRTPLEIVNGGKPKGVFSKAVTP